MNDPAGSSMSMTAVLVMAVVVMVLIVGWLAAVFYAGRDGGSARRAEDHPGHVGQPEAGTPGNLPAGRAG